MTAEIPFGRREDQDLEFKEAAALKDPFSIGREVVSMLNSEGGQVWIGVQEENSWFKGVQLLPDAEPARDRLREHLLDTIQPRTSRGEVDVEVVPYGEGSLLLVRVRPAHGAGPYAQMKKGGQFYWTRSGSLVRPMGRHEVLSPRPSPRFLEELQDRRARERFSGLWIGMAPEGEQAVLEVSRGDIEDLIRDPSSHTAPGSWSCISPWSEVHPVQGDPGGFEVRQGNAIVVRVLRDGIFELLANHVGGLEHNRPGEIHPLALAALTQTFFSFCSRFVGRAKNVAQYRGSAALFGVRGRVLRPFSPRVHAYEYDKFPGHEHRSYEEGDDLVLADPIQFEVRDLRDRPGVSGLRVLTRIYRAFGYEPEQMPHELDRETGELRLA